MKRIIGLLALLTLLAAIFTPATQIAMAGQSWATPVAAITAVEGTGGYCCALEFTDTVPGVWTGVFDSSGTFYDKECCEYDSYGITLDEYEGYCISYLGGPIGSRTWNVWWKRTSGGTTYYRSAPGTPNYPNDTTVYADRLIKNYGVTNGCT